MSQALSHNRLIRYAGLFTWAVIALPLLLLTGGASDGDGGIPDPARRAWIAWGSFGACFLWATIKLDTRKNGLFGGIIVVVLALSSMAISYYSQSGLGSILLMVVACILPWLLPVKLGIALLVFCEFMILPVYVGGLGFTWGEALLQAALYAGFTGFAFVIGYVARQQAQARDQQHRLNAELRATRALLAESVRVNERTRISRELHDLLGHHLTALSLNLEVANHLTEGAARKHVEQAHTIARLLLSDVREAVGRLRRDDAIDMRATLQPLADKVPAIKVKLSMPDPFLLEDAERAHVLLRSTQEIITNTVKHANASRLTLDYTIEDRTIHLRARDNGRGAYHGRPGNGLNGMRERLEAQQGELDIDTRPGNGFGLHLRLPLDDDPIPTPYPGRPPLPKGEPI